MAEWWEAAPVVKRGTGAAASDNWWEDAPVAGAAPDFGNVQAGSDTVSGPRPSLAESLMGRARAGLSATVGGGVQSLGEAMAAPFNPLKETVLGPLFGQYARPGESVAGVGEDIIGMADDYRAEAMQGVTAPTALRDVINDPGNAVRYWGGIGAESAVPIGAAMLTRNPIAASRVIGATTGATEYGSSRAAGDSPLLAGQSAIQSGLIEAGMSQLPFEQALGGQSLGRRLVTVPLSESATEMVTEGGQTLGGAALRGEDVSRAELGRTLVDAGIVGAGMGVGEAVAGRGPQRPAQTPQDPPPATPADAWWADAPIAEPPSGPVTPPAPPAAQPVAPAAASPAVDVPAPPAPAVAEAQPEAPGPEVAAAPVLAEPAVDAPAVTPAAVPEFADYTPGENPIVERSDDLGTYREHRLTRAIVDKHEQTGDVAALLDDLAQQPDLPDGERWLAQKLAPIMRDLGIRITPPTPGQNVGGQWDNKTRSLFVRQATPETILHESLHGATSALIDSPSAQRNPEVRQFVSELRTFGQHLQGALLDFDTRNLPESVQRTIRNPRGPMSNPKELLTYAMTNRGFQDFLRQIPAPPGWRGARTAWDAFKQAVAKLFGAETPAQASLLDAIIESGGGLVDFAGRNPRAVEMVQRLQQGALTGNVPAAPLSAPERTQEAAPAPAAPTPAAQPAAAPATPAPPPSSRSTSTKNAVRDAERAREGRDPIVREAAKSNPQTVADAEAAMAENPALADETVERLISQPSPTVSSIDEAVLLIEKVRLRNERNDAATRAGNARLTPEQRAVAQREWAAAEAKIDRIDQATSASGREWGRLGQFRQRMMREDFTLEAMERRARAVVGGPLSPELQRRIEQQAREIERLQRELAEAESRVLDVETTRLVNETLDRTIREVTAATKRAAKAGKPRADVLKERADAARERLKKRATEDAVEVVGLDFAALTDPDSIADAVTLGAWYVEQGVRDLADFTAKMTADLGASIADLTGRMPEIFARAQQQNAVSEQSYAAGVRTVEQVSGDIDADAVTTSDVRALVQAHVAAGMRDEAEIMAAVTADLTKLGATLTERDVRRLFSEYGKATYPSKDEVRRTMRELRTLVQMQESIDRMTEGLPKLKSGPQRDKATEAIRQKRAQLDEMLRLASARTPMTPERAATLREARVRNLQARIADLQDMLTTGRRPAPRKRSQSADAEVLALEQQRDDLVRQLRDLDRPPRDAEAIYQRSRATSMRNQMEQLQQKLRDGDFTRTVRVPRSLTAENERIAYELDKVKAQYNEGVFLESLKNRTPGQKAFDEATSVINFSRAVLTGPDVSGVGRQGGFLTVGDPKLMAKGLAGTFSALRSDQNMHAAMERIRQSPNARLYKIMGLDFTSNEGKLSSYEEAYQTRLLNLISVEGQEKRNAARKAWNVAVTPWRASSRAYTTGLNVIRASAADALIDSFTDGGPLTTDELVALGRFINTATGRPNFGKWDNGTVFMNLIFFAPRWVASRFNILLKYPAQMLVGGQGMTPRVKMAIAKRYARYAAGLGVINSLAFLAAVGMGLGEDDDDRPFMEWDPRSSAFMMPRFGDTYVDTTSGLSSAARLIAQVVTGERKTASGQIIPLRDGMTLTNGLFRIGESLRAAGMDELAAKFPDKKSRDLRFGDSSVASTGGNFLWTKLAPLPGAIWNSIVGENVIGQKTTPANEAMGMFYPMIFEEAYEMVQEHGALAAPFIASAAFGMAPQLRDPSSFAAPDYKAMTHAERKQYNEYLRATTKTRQDIDSLRDIANAFPKDAHPADVRDAVETRAEQLGLDGVSVGRYVPNTTSRDARGVSRAGQIKRSESGNVEMEYADWSKARTVNNASKQVSAINKQIEMLYEKPVPYSELAEIAGDDYDTSDFGTGESSLDDRMAVALALAKRRAEIMRETMEELR